MSIIQQEVSANKIKVLVNKLKSKDEIAQFIRLLQKDVFYDITFLNVKSLPAPIVLKLYEFKNSIALTVSDKKLKFYLRNLGFRLKNGEYNEKYKINRIDKVQYIGIGGSAGSLNKFIQILEALSPSDLTFFIVMHQKSDKQSSLAKILQAKTKHYKVVEAVSDTKVMPATVYVAPSDKHMIVAGGFVFLSDDEPKHFSKPSISTTFESLAKEYKEQLLTLLVCGYGQDGSDALSQIRQNGGIVIIEQLYECQATPMLENAIYSKEYDFILSIDDINKLLAQKLSVTPFDDTLIASFLQDIYDIYGYDYSNYSKVHIYRRVEHFYHSLSCTNFIEFREKILNNKNLFKDMFLDISINVTTLFRNPKVYKNLRKVLEKEFQEKKNIKIWCAGCSSGEEPYSLAIMLEELGFLQNTLIYATDINDVILQQAKNGIYSKESFKLFQNHYKESGANGKLENYFNEYGNFVQIDKKFQENILFFNHNLVTDGVLNEFQLIFCRNVIIYFDRVLKTRVFTLFDNSLEEDGILVLGEDETYDSRENFSLLDSEIKIYKKNNGV